MCDVHSPVFGGDLSSFCTASHFLELFYVLYNLNCLKIYIHFTGFFTNTCEAHLAYKPTNCLQMEHFHQLNWTETTKLNQLDNTS